MTIQQNILPGSVVKKHNKIIRTKQTNLSVQGARILQNLISSLNKDDTFFYTVSMRVLDIFKNLSTGSDYLHVKSLVHELSNCKVEIERYFPDDPFPTLSMFPFFTSIHYHKGVIHANFNTELYSYLNEMHENFTKYNLIEYCMLKSSYSQRLYEILKSWQNIQNGYIDLELNELYTFLATPESQKKNYGEFRRKVLEVAHKEILAKTAFSYEYEPIKKGNGKTSPVIAIRFIFKKGKNNSKSLPQAKQQLQEEPKGISFDEYLAKNPDNEFLKQFIKK